MNIFSKFPTVNISKLNFWLVICIAKNFIWTTLKMIFSIFRFFCTLRFQIYKYCPIITNHTSMESYLFIFQMLYKSLDPYAWFCAPGSHMFVLFCEADLAHLWCFDGCFFFFWTCSGPFLAQAVGGSVRCGSDRWRTGSVPGVPGVCRRFWLCWDQAVLVCWLRRWMFFCRWAQNHVEELFS